MSGPAAALLPDLVTALTGELAEYMACTDHAGLAPGWQGW
jgi:hypothetical protein